MLRRIAGESPRFTLPESASAPFALPSAHKHFDGVTDFTSQCVFNVHFVLCLSRNSRAPAFQSFAVIHGCQANVAPQMQFNFLDAAVLSSLTEWLNMLLLRGNVCVVFVFVIVPALYQTITIRQAVKCVSLWLSSQPCNEVRRRNRRRRCRPHHNPLSARPLDDPGRVPKSVSSQSF